MKKKNCTIQLFERDAYVDLNFMLCHQLVNGISINQLWLYGRHLRKTIYLFVMMHTALIYI